MDNLKKICICSVDELLNMLKHGLLVDVEHSFAILSLSQNLTTNEGIVSTMAHCSVVYQDIDFDFLGEGLSHAAAKNIATDIIQRAPTVRRWYFVSDEGYRRSAAMCCAVLHYLGLEKEEFVIWHQTEVEVNVSVYALMCRALGIHLEKGDLNRKMNANYEATRSSLPTEWRYTRFVQGQAAKGRHLEKNSTRQSINEIHK